MTTVPSGMRVCLCAAVLLILASCDSTPELELVDPDCAEDAGAALAYTGPAPERQIRHSNVFVLDHELQSRKLTDEGASHPGRTWGRRVMAAGKSAAGSRWDPTTTSHDVDRLRVE